MRPSRGFSRPSRLPCSPPCGPVGQPRHARQPRHVQDRPGARQELGACLSASPGGSTVQFLLAPMSLDIGIMTWIVLALPLVLFAAPARRGRLIEPGISSCPPLLTCPLLT